MNKDDNNNQDNTCSSVHQDIWPENNPGGRIGKRLAVSGVLFLIKIIDASNYTKFLSSSRTCLQMAVAGRDG